MAGFFGLGGGVTLSAQEPPQEPAEKPADAPPPKPKPPAKTNKDNATESAPDQPMWDPLRAEKDLELTSHIWRLRSIEN